MHQLAHTIARTSRGRDAALHALIGRPGSPQACHCALPLALDVLAPLNKTDAYALFCCKKKYMFHHWPAASQDMLVCKCQCT